MQYIIKSFEKRDCTIVQSLFFQKKRSSDSLS